MNKQLMNGFWVMVLAYLMLASGSAQAACTQADLTGVWFLNGTASDLIQRRVNETNVCKIKFSSSGGVLTGSSSCIARRSTGSYAVNIKGGNVTLNGACELKGQLEYCTLNFCSSIVLNGARMDSNKSTIAFLGYVAYSPAIIFDWTGVKK